MKQKFIAGGLSVLLLLVQNSIVFSQTAPPSRSTDELIALLGESEAVAVVNVKKTLTEIAPVLLNNDAANIEKIGKMMKSIENETGVNPFTIDRIVFGMSFSKTNEPPMLLIQTADAAATAANMYQNRLANAKLADEINPLKNRVVFLEDAMSPIQTKVIPQNQSSAADLKTLEDFQADLAKIKLKTGEQAAVKKLQTDSAKLYELLKNYETLSQTVYNLGDLPERLEAVKNEVNKISAGDAQRAAKIAAHSKTLAQIEQEFMTRRGRMMETDDALMFENFGTDTFVGVTYSFATETVAERSIALAEMQASLDQRIENVKSVMATMKSTEPPTNSRMKDSDEKTRLNAPHPASTTVTRKEETVGGKKMLVFTTLKKFPEKSEMQSASDDVAMLLYDDKTLLISERASIAQSLENQTASRNQPVRSLIAKSPDALVSFGADLRNINLTDLSKAFGEQKTALQAYGALSSTGNDLSLTATIEKSDVPLNLPPKTDKTDEVLKVPTTMTGGDALSDLLDLMIKSISGIEGKLTLRFEKKRAVAILENLPPVLGELINGKQTEQEKK